MWYTVITMKKPVYFLIATILGIGMAAIAPAKIVSPKVEAVEVQSKPAVTEVIKKPPQKLREELMVVCSCESTGVTYNDPNEYHFEGDGVTPIYGINKSDRGMCQINMVAHKKASESMGLDILKNLDDYIIYSNWLYETEGLTPWRYSEHCWGV